MNEERRVVLPHSQKQLVNSYAGNLKEVKDWLDSLTRVHENGEERYYLHIDHMQIFPSQTLYRVIAIYHRVYLVQG